MIHVRFSSLDEIDFDRLFEASLPRMDAGTYPWPEGIDTTEKKRTFIRAHVERVMSQPNSFCFKGVLDGTNISAIFGTVRRDQFYGALSLAGPDGNGSRAYAYDQAVIADMQALLATNGITEFYGFMPKASPLRATIPARHDITDNSYSPHLRDGVDTGQDLFRLC